MGEKGRGRGGRGVGKGGGDGREWEERGGGSCTPLSKIPGPAPDLVPFSSYLTLNNKFSSDERLFRLRLHSLELRRLLTDLVWCYKILFGIVEMSAAEEFFLYSGHAHKLEATNTNCLRNIMPRV